MQIEPMPDHEILVAAGPAGAVPVHLATPAGLAALLEGLPPAQRRFAEAQAFGAESGALVVLPDADGAIAAVLYGLGDEADPMAAGKLGSALPDGAYRLVAAECHEALATLAVALGSYRFERYRKPKDVSVTLSVAERLDIAELRRIRDGVFWARDLINIPASDMAPRDLARAAGDFARRTGGRCRIVEGEDLASGFPLVHAVGAGSDRPPCLIDMDWGDPGDPRVTLVGKGVVFDTGGLDIKTSSGMLLMKKDMGGAAAVLGLASMIVDAGLKVRLRVIVPAVENSISGRAFRPGDILKSRKGLSVEIGNTDAEGRLVLADALALADEDSPDLLVTIATLTGAARVALGPDLPPFYCDDAAFVRGLESAAAEVGDPVWRMPFFQPYDAWLKSKVADLNNVSSNGFAGSVVAALFLRRFTSQAATFAHFDIYGWNPVARPTTPQGGEAQAIRALYRYLSQRFG